ncbi:MAG: restriction endonuclease [Alphaproteobacteria bacterium]|nr:restriction endonuclease [Alphaproteobacteria bacterium]
MNYTDIFNDCKTGVDFENRIVDVFRLLGFEANKTGSNDGGVDIIVEGLLKYYIQCKFYNRPLGKTPIQEVYSGTHYYGNDGTPVVITNNHVTVEARLYANKLGVEIISDTEWVEFKRLMHGELTHIPQRAGLFGIMVWQVSKDNTRISDTASASPTLEKNKDLESIKLQIKSEFDEAEECIKEAAYLQEQALRYSQRALKIQQKAILFTLEHG